MQGAGAYRYILCFCAGIYTCMHSASDAALQQRERKGVGVRRREELMALGYWASDAVKSSDAT